MCSLPIKVFFRQILPDIRVIKTQTIFIQTTARTARTASSQTTRARTRRQRTTRVTLKSRKDRLDRLNFIQSRRNLAWIDPIPALKILETNITTRKTNFIRDYVLNPNYCFVIYILQFSLLCIILSLCMQ